METDISIIDDVSLERIFIDCSDRTIAYLMISIKPDDLSRVLKVISKEHKVAVQIELKMLEEETYLNIEQEVATFWKLVRALESGGEIIISKHTANCI